MPTRKVLFLYTEMAGYMLSCMKKLAADRNVEVHVVVYPVNPVAPFQFDWKGERLFVYPRENYRRDALLKLAGEINPSVIFCSGWIDRDYLAVCRQYKKSVPTVMTLDNPWRSTLKQLAASVAGPLLLGNYFTHCWACGTPQVRYAKHLGFKASHIREGLYSCDFDYFHAQYELNRARKAASFPHRLIYVGRYATLKGVRELWQAFQLFQEQQPSDWELWCFGKGPFEPEFPKHEKIKNLGFVQPEQMKTYLAETGVFILPAHYEHWGVVVHEFAAAGFPLICSTTTSAALKFLDAGVNGYFHAPCSVPALVETFQQVARTPDAAWIEMGDRSATNARKITRDTWCDTALDFAN